MRIGLAALGLVTAMCVSACGSGAGDDHSADDHAPHSISELTGSWTSDSVDDPDVTLVPGSTIRLSFEDDSLSLVAGCNTHFGAASVDDGHLVVPMLASTEMGCEDQLQRQDQWLSSFLDASPAIELHDDELRLRVDDTVIVFVRE